MQICEVESDIPWIQIPCNVLIMMFGTLNQIFIATVYSPTPDYQIYGYDIKVSNHDIYCRCSLCYIMCTRMTPATYNYVVL